LEYDVQQEIRTAIKAGAGDSEPASAAGEEAAATGEHFRAEIQATPAQTLAALDEAAEMWDAVWEAAPNGGRLHLPVLAGIRQGSVVARVEAKKSSAGTDLTLDVEDSAYRVNRPAAVFLSLGALGGIAAVAWPIYPEKLLPFVPLGLVMAIGAWLLVVSRLRTAGPDDFLDTVAELAEDDGEPDREPHPPTPIEP